MKFLKKMIGGAALMLAIALPCASKAQVTPGVLFSLTNTPNVFTITNAVAGTNIIDLQENCGAALATTFSTPTAAAVGCGMWIWLSVDGTNYPATPIILTANSSGATSVTVQTNWSAAVLSGYRRMKVQLTNACAGNLTNQQMFRRWNPPQR